MIQACKFFCKYKYYVAVGHYTVILMSNILYVFFISMLPILELRASIPVGYTLGFPIFSNVIISVIGNMLPIPFILIFINKILHFMSNSRISFFNKTAGFVLKKADKNKDKITKYATWGLFLFVAIPLPGTGAWTGALVASLLNMKRSKALISIFAGVLAAATLVSLICYGFIDFLRFLI